MITDEDMAFYKKIGVPPPTLCPEERQRRRMSLRNHFNLYHRKCDKTGKQIISLYDTDSPFTIYNQDFYWGDKWDPLAYGRDFDFNKSFFEQFKELQKVVPRVAINGLGNENCEYTSYCGFCRNCYLAFTTDYSEDCYFGEYSMKCKNCVDFSFSFDSQLCYSVSDLKNCFHCMYAFNLENCSDCFFSRDLIGCHDCFGCINLRNAQYCFFNERLSKEEYMKKMKGFRFDSYSSVQDLKKQLEQFFLRFPRKSLNIKGSENVTGDHIKFSKNCQNAYDISDCQDCKYVSHLIGAKDCMDWDFYGERAELCYEMSSSAGNINYCSFCSNCWDDNYNLLYCDLVTGSKNCFGCIGLRHASYCILNKQYTQEEYEKLLPKIIKHMESTGEWGEFFPSELSPYGYNETLAQDYLPLTQEEVAKRGLKWKNKNEKIGYQGPKFELPDSILEADEKTICDKILTCEGSGVSLMRNGLDNTSRFATSGANFKIIPQELKFYKQFAIPLPRQKPYQRYLDRMAVRNPRNEFVRSCAKCGQEMKTSYAPERPEIVYCEKCYLEEVY